MGKLGLFGGTFNPIHLAHLRAAEEAVEAAGLGRMLFVPSATPPHKGTGDLAPAADRLAMCRLATAANPRFEVSDIEIRRGGASYSVETLRELHAGGETDPYFLIGQDAFDEIESWREWRALFDLAHFLVMNRPGSGADVTVPGPLRSAFQYEPEGHLFRSATGRTVRRLTITALDISSSKIRALVRSGRSTRYLAPEAVSAYIQEHGLYQERGAP